MAKQFFFLAAFPLNLGTDTNNSPPSTHTPSSNGSLVDEMDLDTHISSPSTVSVDMDVASLSDTLDLSILEEDLLFRQIRDLSSSPTPPPLLQVSHSLSSDSLNDNNKQTSTHQQLLEDARAGKRVNRKEQQQSTKSVMPVLPTELLIKVFECLAGLQADLCSAALVSIEWNLCATGQLYRYPEFANTIHWAMFIQTLCKNKEDELKRPTSRRNRPPIFSPSCLSPHFGDHPPILLAPEQMASFGAKIQQPRKRDRLDRTLGEYVRGVDLSRKAIGASRLCPCGRPYGPPVAMKECSVCVRPGKAPASKTAGNAQKSIPGVCGSNGQGDQGANFIFRDDVPDDEDEETVDGYMDSLECLDADHDRQDGLTSVGAGLRPRTLQSSNAGLGQPGQPGSNTPGSSLASNHFMSLLNWPGQLLSPMTNNSHQALRRFTATRANAAVTTGTATTSMSSLTTATATATTSSTTTTTAAAAATSPITMARSRRMAAGKSRGEPLLTLQDEPSQLPGNDTLSLQGGAGNRGTVSLDKDAISTRKPMTITVSSLIQMARHCPHLEWLCLASTALADDTLYLETGDYMSTLQPGPRSGLTNIQVTVMEGIGALGQSCPNLGRVWLVGCDWVTHREVLALTKSCRRLHMMDVRHCPRLEGRLSRLYTVMEGPVNDDTEAVNRTKNSDMEVGKDVVPNEKVAIPLQFETAPTTVLLGANVSGRGVRDGAMDDLFYFVYITAFVSSPNTSIATAVATALPTATTTSTTTTTTSLSSAAAASTSTTLSPQAVNDILSLLSSVALAREAPTDLLAFREWFKAVQDFDLVSYESLKRWKFRSLIGCQPGEQLNSGNGGGGGASSGSSSSSSSSSSISGSNSSSNPQQKYFTYDTDSDSGEGDDNEETLAELDD